LLFLFLFPEKNTTPPYANKHKQDMSPHTNNWR